jgi:hypothetical protein
MLVSRRDGYLLLVDQNEHGRLAGEIAARWGNDRFAPPARRDSALIAAAMHDEGWREADATPLFNFEEHRPLHFLEIDMSEHVPLYRRGVERVLERDAYAGLLVSMHWTGLYRGRWGLQSGGVFRTRAASAATRLQDEAVEEQERRWTEIKRELIFDEPRSDFEAALWNNYDLLQAFDLLSLYLCTANLAPAAGARPERVTAVLGAIDQQPGPRLISSVPVRQGGARADLLLEPTAEGAVIADPFPFEQDPVDFALSGKAIPDERYESADAVSDALKRAETSALVFRVSGPNAAGERSVRRREAAAW